MVDDHTFKATFEQFNKLTMPDLVVPVPVDRQLGTGEEARHRRKTHGRWNGSRTTTAGGGAFKVESLDTRPADHFHPIRRLEVGAAARSSSASSIKQIPPPGRARALLEKGDVDMSVGLPPKDYAELAQAGKGQGHRRADPERPGLRRHEREDSTVRQSEGARSHLVRDPL